MSKENIKIDGHFGTWHSVDEKNYGNHMLFLMEHDEFGDEADFVIIDEDNDVVIEDVSNGFDELRDNIDDLTIIDKETENVIEIFLVWYKDCNKFIIMSVSEKYSEEKVFEFSKKFEGKERVNG